MARHWKEPLDPKKHRDFTAAWVGGVQATAPPDNLIQRYAYFVRVCQFTFEFVELDHLRTYLDHFRQKLHPSTSYEKVPLSHWYPRWYEKLPERLFREKSRQKIVKSLEEALAEFEKIDG